MEHPERDIVPLPSTIMSGLARHSLERQYTGTLADGDAKSLITRTYNTTKDEAAAVDRIAGSPDTLYISHGDFVRHAVFELLMAYEEAGFPDSFIPDVLGHIRLGRENAMRTRIRQQFGDILLTHENSIIDGVETGDFELVANTLLDLEGYTERTPEIHWKRYLWRTVLRSGVIRMGVDALSEQTHQSTPEWSAGWAAITERWHVALEGLGE